MWLLLLRGASVRSDDPGPMEPFVGSFSPQRAGKRMFRHFNPHRWTGPDDPRAHLSLGPEGRARASRIGRGLSLASVHRRKPNFQYVTFAVLIVEPSMATCYMVPMSSMIDIYDCIYN